MSKHAVVGFALLLTSALAGTALGADYGEYIASVDHAIQSGDSVEAVALLCDWNQGVAEYSKAHDDEVLAAMKRWQAFWHQRYLAVFQPPAPVETYFDAGLPWEEWGMACAFGAMRGDGSREVYEEGRLTVPDSAGMIVVDLDRNGQPEMTYDGRAPEFSSMVSVAHDDAGDGQREQWLAAPKGSNPRTAATIWLYRDGPTISVIIKPPDDHPCGRSKCFGSGL